MKKAVRTAIIGTGKAAHMHAAVLQKIEQSAFTAVCSRSKEHANAFAEQYGIKGYSNVSEMISENKIEMAIVCTPHPYHKQSTVDALQAGANVLVEKPLAANLHDCDEMIGAAKQAKKKLGVVSQRRFFPASMRCKKAIEEGKIGTPMLGTVTMLGWRDKAYYESDPWRGKWNTEGGGVLVNQAPHQLDLLLWYMDSQPTQLFGVWKNINHPYIEVEDTALAIMQFQSGAAANIVVSNSQKPGLFGNVHIHGSNGASVGVQTDAGAMFIAGSTTMVEAPSNDIWSIEGEAGAVEKFKNDDKEFFKGVDPIHYSIREQQLDFVNAIVEDRKPMISGEDGRMTVEVFSAIYESMRTGATVQF